MTCLNQREGYTSCELGTSPAAYFYLGRNRYIITSGRVKVFLDLLDHSQNLSPILAAALPTVFLAVQEVSGILKHDLEAPSCSPVFGRDHADAAAELRIQVELEAVVEPLVPSASAVHYLLRKRNWYVSSFVSLGWSRVLIYVF